MNTLVEIQPRELKFKFELKKQSMCTVHLANITDQYVAFKVKTTSPKKYCVRPNVGIIKPKSSYDFTVTMQAQKSLPSDMQCKDKFLIQSTVAPFGTTEDEITPDMFMKNSEKYIEETKLRVVLTSAPNSPVMPQSPEILKQEESEEAFMMKKPRSPVLMSFDGSVKQEPSDEPLIALSPKVLKQEASSEAPSIALSHKDLNQEASYEAPSIVLSPTVSKQEASYEALTPKESHSPNLLPVNGVAKKDSSYVMPLHKSEHGVQDSSLPDMLMKKEEQIQNSRKVEESIPPKIMEKLRPPVQVNDQEAKQVKEIDGMVPVPANDREAKPVKEMEDIKLKLVKDIEELKMKITSMDVKLVEAHHTILKLKEEKSSSVHDMEVIKQELAMVRRTGGSRKAHVGFPPLFVVMVSIISLVLGFLFRS